MRFQRVRPPEQLDLQAIHRVRERLINERTGVINQVRAFLLENGVAVAAGKVQLARELPRVLAQAEGSVSLNESPCPPACATLASNRRHDRRTRRRSHRGCQIRSTHKAFVNRARHWAASWPARLLPQLEMPRTSAEPATSLPGSDWCPPSTLRVAGGKPRLLGLRYTGQGISDVFSFIEKSSYRCLPGGEFYETISAWRKHFGQLANGRKQRDCQPPHWLSTRPWRCASAHGAHCRCGVSGVVSVTMSPELH
jgi:uncharacterized protein (DUF1684 family)